VAGIGLYDGYPDVSLDLVRNRIFDGRLQLLDYIPTVLAGPPGASEDDTRERASSPVWALRNQTSRAR
jgi:hypothetical protein